MPQRRGCTRALMAGFAEQEQVLDELVLRQVIADLETATSATRTARSLHS